MHIAWIHAAKLEIEKKKKKTSGCAVLGKLKSLIEQLNPAHCKSFSIFYTKWYQRCLLWKKFFIWHFLHQLWYPYHIFFICVKYFWWCTLVMMVIPPPKSVFLSQSQPFSHFIIRQVRELFSFSCCFLHFFILYVKCTHIFLVYF